MTTNKDAAPSDAFEDWASEEGINNFHFNHCWEAWQAALLSAKRAAVPEDWKLVPAEVTEEMLNAWFDTPSDTAFADGGITYFGSRYRAMLAASPAASYAEPANVIYVECRQCDNCDHIGINDGHATESACSSCRWSGPTPTADKCPGCGDTNCMTIACPECSNRYTLLADGRFPADEHRTPAAPAQSGQWFHCSPALIQAGVSCANTPRRACACEPENGGHDHFIAHEVAPAQSGEPVADNAVTVARMGYGAVAVGICLSEETGEPGIIYMALDEAGEIGRDTTDVYPIGSRPAAERVLACVSFKTPASVDQTISILEGMKAQYWPDLYAAPQPAQTETAPLEWQPIETAPKNWKWLMLFARYPSATVGTPHFGYFNPINEKWYESGLLGTCEIIPSHWMARPEFPAAQPASGGAEC